MKILELLNSDVKIDFKKPIFFGAVSGLATTSIIILINLTVETLEAGQTSLVLLALFVLCTLVYVISQNRLMRDFSRHVESVCHHKRLKLIKAIHDCELEDIEKLGSEEVIVTLSEELQVVSNFATLMIITFQSAILALFLMVYIGLLSLIALITVVLSLAVGVTLTLMRSDEIRKNQQKTFNTEMTLMEDINDLLNGFKEIKLNKQRSEALSSLSTAHSEELQKTKSHLGQIFAKDYVNSQFSFYLALAVIIFMNPIISSGHEGSMTKVVAAALFLIGPISSVIGSIADYSRANSAARNILNLESKLKRYAKRNLNSKITHDFDEIKLVGLSYHHKDPDGATGFEVGPIDLTIERGSMLMITGGNGSGKTTLLKMLTGLYQCQSGQIEIDGVPITDKNTLSYRKLFSSVFSDFYLFRRIYGVSNFAEEEVSDLLRLFEIDHKVSVEDGRFSTTELSQGQRKRLGLITAILEKRKVYVLDEFAADQDPEFRRKFYLEIIPLLRDQGATIIAISHDDNYFHLSDSRISMRDGRLEQTTGEQQNEH